MVLGLFNRNGKLAHGPALLNKADISSVTGSGQYCLFEFHDTGDISIRTDPFGMYPLFYTTSDDGAFAISNRLHLLSKALASRSALLLDPHALYSQLLYDGSMCMQLTGRRTHFANISMSQPEPVLSGYSARIEHDV